jgi:hypothetical protein
MTGDPFRAGARRLGHRGAPQHPRSGALPRGFKVDRLDADDEEMVWAPGDEGSVPPLPDPVNSLIELVQYDEPRRSHSEQVMVAA